ncbi:hypothetical protein J1N35_022157 [Gossypium stocksii]|uniref:Uncharacterized protein n=1 Tax=Gossypium stocksii TaxID=47602 RepID=A0A9D3VGM8_9ROSI|nr:hypothetical protein J1N35_022157 [Gossypium stocksii]
MNPRDGHLPFHTKSMEPLSTSLTHSISTLPPIRFSASAPRCDCVVTVEKVSTIENNNVFNEKLPLEEPKVESATDEDS